MVALEHSFTTSKPIDESWRAILDLDRLVPCVEGGSVTERTGPESVKAEIKVKMGAMSMNFAGTVTVTEQDEASHRAVMQVKSKEVGDRATLTPRSCSRSRMVAGPCIPRRRSPARPRPWAKASCPACSMR